MRPPFIQVIPDEIERYGASAAVVLAHIRYRCESDGPDRIEIDGFRWWRVSRRGLGHEIGSSADAVKRALQKLGPAVVSANNFDRPEDQTRAYRPAVDSDPLSCQKAKSPRPELPEDEIAKAPGRNRHGTGAKPPSALPIETLEKGGEGVAGRGPDTAPPPPTRSAMSNTANARPRCKRHAHIPDDADVPDCPRCGALRARYEAEQTAAANRAAAERAAIRRAIDDCDDCDQYGRDWMDPSVDCKKHRNFRRKATTPKENR